MLTHYGDIIYYHNMCKTRPARITRTRHNPGFSPFDRGICRPIIRCICRGVFVVPFVIRNLTSAMNKHGREKFVSVILLTGINEKELDSVEIALIETLVTLPGKTGYNIKHGSLIGRDGIMRYNYRAVVITILDTGSELYFNNFLEAANGMGVSEATIVLLANNNNPYR